MEQPDAPSSVANPAPSSAPVDVLASLSSTERSEWRKTGHLPERPESSSNTAASTPAEPAEQAASTDARPAPASEPGQPSKKANAESRKAELTAEIQTLLKQRADLQRELQTFPTRPTQASPTPPAASSPARPEPVSVETFLASPDPSSPLLSEAEFFAQFPDAAYGTYGRYTARYEIAAARQAERAAAEAESRHAERDTRRQQYEQRREDAARADPQFLTKVQPLADALVPTEFLPAHVAPTAHNAIAQEIFVSPVGPKLLLHFTDHPDEYQRIASLPTGYAIARAIGKLEATLEAPTAPPLKTTSSAPPPPATLGSKATTPGSTVEDAVRAGNFAAYKAEKNRLELTAR